jgi:hypothetical protein
MSPEAQRIAIAEVMGWKREGTCTETYSTGDVVHQCWKSPDGKTLWWGSQIAGLPDYLTDLNAMAEAERILTDEQRVTYAANVEAIVENEIWEACGKPERGLKQQLCLNTGDPHGTADYFHLYAFITATCAQRAEAFLRTIGKWTE